MIRQSVMNKRDTPKASIWMGLVQNAINGNFSMEQTVKGYTLFVHVYKTLQYLKTSNSKTNHTLYSTKTMLQNITTLMIEISK